MWFQEMTMDSLQSGTLKMDNLCRGLLVMIKVTRLKSQLDALIRLREDLLQLVGMDHAQCGILVTVNH